MGWLGEAAGGPRRARSEFVYSRTGSTESAARIGIATSAEASANRRIRVGIMGKAYDRIPHRGVEKSSKALLALCLFRGLYRISAL